MFRLDVSPPFAQGFSIGFSNGWTFSVQFGSGAYCTNRREKAIHSSPDAEIMAFDYADRPYCFVEEQAVGWVKPDRIPEMMGLIASLSRGYHDYAVALEDAAHPTESLMIAEQA